MDEPLSRSPPMSHGTALGLWLIVTGNILVSSVIWGFATYWSVATGLIPWFSWLNVFLVGIVSAQVILLAISMLLLEFRRSLKWVTTLIILAASAASMTLGLIVGYSIATGRGIAPGQGIVGFFSTTGILWLGVYFAFALTVGVFTVLGLQVLLWPIAASLGWQLHYSDRISVRANPRFSLLQLFGWIGFIAALLSLFRTLAEVDDRWFAILIFSLLWMVPALLAAIPTMLIAARAVRTRWWLALLLVPYLAFLSYLESEVTVIPFRLGITGAWWPVWILLIFNGGIAATVLVNAFLVRTCGFILELPLWPRRISADPSRSSRI